jgi:hypothetical protein
MLCPGAERVLYPNFFNEWQRTEILNPFLKKLPTPGGPATKLTTVSELQ